MKKLILIIVLGVSANLLSLNFNLSFSLNTAKESELLEYIFSSGFNLNDKIEAQVEYERRDGKTYLNYDSKIAKKWQYVIVSVKKNYVQGKTDQIFFEALGRVSVEQKKWKFIIIKLLSNGYWSGGIRQEWINKIPSTNIILGKTYLKELKFFLTPAQFKYSLFYYSSDFKKWKKESAIDFHLSILANLDLFMTYLLSEDYFKLRTGIEIKL